MTRCIAIAVAGFFGSLALPAGLGGQQPCNGHCWVCDAGHAANFASYTHMVNGAHECGNLATCDVYPHNQPCDRVLAGVDGTEFERRLRDIWERDLSGEELFRIASALNGLVYLNVDRQALQLRSCDDPSRIVGHLPLSSEQVADFMAASRGRTPPTLQG